ncbi:MAG: hypothetical protein ACK56I_35655, partial [bacterium]
MHRPRAPRFRAGERAQRAGARRTVEEILEQHHAERAVNDEIEVGGGAAECRAPPVRLRPRRIGAGADRGAGPPRLVEVE